MQNLLVEDKNINWISFLAAVIKNTQKRFFKFLIIKFFIYDFHNGRVNEKTSASTLTEEVSLRFLLLFS